MAEEATPSKTANQPPFGAEYAKSNRASCKACQQKIAQGSLRMATRFPSRHFDGMQDNWFHYECFWKRSKVDNLNDGTIRGMENLKWEDQEMIRKRIIEIKENAPEVETPKTHIPKAELAKTSAGKCYQCKEKIAKGELRIQLKASNFHPKCLKELEAITGGAESIQDFDLLDDENKAALVQLFGKAAEKRKAPVDEDGTGETPAKKPKIENEADETLRAHLKEQSDALWQVRKDLTKHVTRDEIDVMLQANGRFRRKNAGPDATIEQLADCIVFGTPKQCSECNNGSPYYSATKHTYACNGHVSEYTPCPHTDRNPPRTQCKIPKALKESNEFLKTHKFPTLKQRYYAPGSENVEGASSSSPLDKIKPKKRRNKKEEPKRQELVKNGCTVDGKCDIADEVHVFIDHDKTVWQATLGKTNIAENKNSFYKLQLLKHDSKPEYYVFRSWGRIGTDYGGFLTDHCADLDDAKKIFKKHFLEKSRNEWENRQNYVMHPGGMSMLEMELDGQDALKSETFDVSSSTSTLPEPIKRLIGTIFDVNNIRDTLKALDIDVEKMPLGKISKKTIMKAMKVLKELENFVQNEGTATEILDASNRFYTLVPHSFGSSVPPLLNNDKIIHDKTNLLNDLSEIEIAYSIIKADEEDEENKADPIDKHFEKLHCKIEVLPKETEEFEIIESYAKKTHAPTHSDYTLEIMDVFKIDRDGEAERFKSAIGNRHLLWHGSKTSNYAGILSQGLRIAPPEAPVNGYMFGKGVYFADMVSKSANYCGAAVSQGEGFLLLCDVALGEIQEEKAAKENIRKPKKDKSSVKGLGQIVPDLSTRRLLEDGVVVPIGKPTKPSKNSSSYSLLYNEYIVYDEAQVKMKYLVRAKFNMK